ncbi:MAG TPA: phosphate ABC transporter permease PstA [Anaerolineaceae bacterium]|nr:phosphate ABC transporter permease PstA [Anaerolineaceae bacterium]
MNTTLPLQSTSAVHFIRPQVNYNRRIRSNAFMLVLMGLLTLIAIIPLFWIIIYVLIKGGQYINLAFFTQMPLPVGMPGGGVLNAIEGTFILTILSGIFSIPPGVLAAFYAAYHPNTPLGIAVRFGTDVLSGVPSIVIGIFGYALVVKPEGHYSAFAGGVVLAILMLPIIIRTTEEMIKLVPQTLREGSLALGSPEWITALKVTLPAALNGIITGFLLGIARASGETAPLLFTALGNDRYEMGRIIQSGISSHHSIFTIIGSLINQPVDSLPLTLYKYTQQPSVERVNQAWAVAVVLMGIVLLINIAARVWVYSRTSHR